MVEDGVDGMHMVSARLGGLGFDGLVPDREIWNPLREFAMDARLSETQARHLRVPESDVRAACLAPK